MLTRPDNCPLITNLLPLGLLRVRVSPGSIIPTTRYAGAIVKIYRPNLGLDLDQRPVLVLNVPGRIEGSATIRVTKILTNRNERRDPFLITLRTTVPITN